jgi:hypothetical protein
MPMPPRTVGRLQPVYFWSVSAIPFYGRTLQHALRSAAGHGRRSHGIPLSVRTVHCLPEPTGLIAPLPSALLFDQQGRFRDQWTNRIMSWGL